MIASLEGVVESVGADSAVIAVGGVGFRVYMPTSVLSTLGGVGKSVRLRTHLHVKDDDMSLYGFATDAELWLFETLITVSGLGPRLGLAMLSTLRVDQLTMAIAAGNAEVLTAVPGIGTKMAERVVLELKDMVGAGLIGEPVGQISQENTDVLAALTALGYSVGEASQAVAGLPSDSDMALEERITQALQSLGG